MEEEIKKEEIKEKEIEEVQEKEKEEEKEAETAKEKEKPLDKMTVKELKEIALEIPGLTGVNAMKKDQLLKVIKEERGITDEKPVKKIKKKAPKKEFSVKDLKKKIVQLKEEKGAARKMKDRKKIDIFRRRINRLKKRTRKVAQA